MPDEPIPPSTVVVEANLPLVPDKELDLLIKSIEEASKQTKEVLLVLLVASSYILVAVFASRSTDTIQLPLLGVVVSNNLFLGVSPLLIVIPYLYLQLCVKDLRERIRIFDLAKITIRYVPSSGLLLFPFFVTRGFYERRLFRRLTPEEKLKVSGTSYDSYLWTTTMALVWGFAPAILATLWIRFINKQQIESLIPCFALIAAFYGSSVEVTKTRLASIAGVLASLLLILVSVASVANLRRGKALEAAWTASLIVGRHIVNRRQHAFTVAIHVGTWVATAVAGILIALTSFSYTEETDRHWSSLEETWIKLEDRKQNLFYGIAARLLYPFLRSSWKSLAVVVGITAFAITFLIKIFVP
jgi:hypothetical protein